MWWQSWLEEFSDQAIATTQYVSELIEAGAPNKTILDPLFAIYNILTIAFGIGLFLYIRGVSENRRKMVGMIGALILVAEGILGFVTVFFPQDPIGSPATTTGNMHIILASLSSLTTMLAMFSSACGPGSCQICAITGSTLMSL